jgi:hypothetical protein
VKVEGNVKVKGKGNAGVKGKGNAGGKGKGNAGGKGKVKVKGNVKGGRWILASADYEPYCLVAAGRGDQ